ncbi:YadA family autotransporter adhesin, partial [Snodgrassella alvi]|uniref:YadA family autotransporter adhesin n=1 Tax=Snodgrassella alvi TaxID=1196083 RepID=UPI0015D52BD6
AYDATRGGSTQKLSGIKEGYIAADSTDAINGSQLHSLSTVTQLGLDDAASGLSSLSVSTATGLNSLSSSINSSLSNATEGVTELKQNALQWNNNIGAYDAARNGNIQKITNVAAGTVGENSTDAVNAGQLFSLSNSTSTGLSSLSSSLSTITENQMGDMSGTVSRLNENVSSLSTGLSTIDGSVTALQQNALQWNSNIGAYDATRGGSTQKLSGIKEGYIAADSTDAINGSQLHSLSTVTQLGLDDAASGLSSLSVSTATGLNSLSSSMNSVNQNLTTLQQDALQWNSNIGAYDASRNGDAQRITNVAAGRVEENSTDAVNAGQLFKLSNSTSTGLSSLSTAVSDIGSISVSMSTGYNELLSSLSTTQDQLGQLETSTNNKLTSLDTNYQNIRNDVDKLRENSLKWNNDLGNGEGGFDASRPNSLTRAPSYGKIVNLADGSLEPDSHEAVNGGQLRIVKDDLLSLSSSTSTGLSSLASMMANTSTNALQWNSNIGAYDAARNGDAKRITNVAAGTLGENSTDAINGHQLWEVRNDLNSLSTTVNNLPTGGNISQDALNSLSTSISASVASQIASMSSALGGTKQSNSDGSNQPSYNVSLASSGDIFSHDIYTHDGSKKTVTNVRDALQGIQENGTKYESINSMKTQAKATGMESIAIGGDAMASGASAIAIGDSASAPESNSVAMGQGAKSQKAGGVALGAGSVADRAGNRRKGNVYIPETATDSQAKAILATESDEYGAVSVGNAKEGQYRQITGVAAGTEDSDAVNVAQLKGVNNQIGNINKYVNKINERVQRTERRAYSGTALAMALSGAYLPSLNAGEQAVGVGVGTYRGYTAVGANYKAISNSGNVGWGAGVSTTGKEVGFNAGVGFKWGGN